MRKIKHCCSLAAAALLVACATQAPTQTQTSNDEFEVPIGYKKSMVNGEARYCRTDVETGSRLSRTTVCYTMAQLQAQQSDNQNNISNQIQNANGLGTAVGAAGGGGGR